MVSAMDGFELKAFKRFHLIFNNGVCNCLGVFAGVCDGCAVFLIRKTEGLRGSHVVDRSPQTH